MPDLHLDSVHAFWDSYDRKTLYRVIVNLEKVENWVVDNESDVEMALLELGYTIDSMNYFDLAGHEDKFLRVLANICASRSVRLLQALDIAKSGFASRLLMHAEEIGDDKKNTPGNNYAKLFLTRNLVFEKLQLLSRIFSQQRMSLILKAMESWSEDYTE